MIRLVAALLLSICIPHWSAATTRPNLLLVMVDDLGFSDLGCYGSEIETPHLDRLAAGGLRMTQFYNTAKCHSSRVSLLSGRWCRQAGDESLLRAVTTPEVLAPAGYFTAMSGKWHLKKEPTDFARLSKQWHEMSANVLMATAKERAPVAGAATGQCTGGDPGLAFTLPKCQAAGPFTLEFRLQSTASGAGEIYWTTDAATMLPKGRHLDFPVTHDGAWHTHTVRIEESKTLHALRLDPCGGAGKVTLDGLTLKAADGTIVGQWP